MSETRPPDRPATDARFHPILEAMDAVTERFELLAGEYRPAASSGRQTPVTRALEQADRQRWRALYLVVRAKLEAVQVGTAVIGAYYADFRYRETKTGARIVEDAKGVRTDVYRLKQKLVQVTYGIVIREV